MKKIMITVLSFFMLVSVSVLVEGSGFGFVSDSNFLQNDKVKIKKEELPEATKSTLNGDAFKGWNVEKAYKLSNGEFEVELKKGDTSQMLKFDKDGKMK